MNRVLQVSRSVIEGGFDYHTEIARAFGERAASVSSVFQRGMMSADRRAEYPGRVICLDARNRRIYKQRSVFTLALWCLNGPGRVDLAICHHMTPARAVDPLVAMGRVRRAYLVVHDHGYFDANDSEGRKRRRFLQRALRRSWGVIGVSDAICRDVRAQVPALTAGRCRCIPNGIDVDGLMARASDRGAARRALGLSMNDFVFGTVGRLVAFKAHRELIDAFAIIKHEVPTAILVIVGRGPLETSLQRQIDERGLTGRVRLCGFIEDAARHMRAFDVFVLPSHNEPFGLVLLEAMACGVPVIASDSGGPAEILPLPEQLFETADVQQMARRLLDLYRATGEERSRLGEAGRRRALARFEGARYREAYASLLDEKDAPSP